MSGVDQLSLVLGFDTDELRRLANSRIGDATIQHAIDTELLRRERADELADFTQRIACATPDAVHVEENRWCCLPGPLADAHRQVLTARENELATARGRHALAGGGAA